MKYQSATAHSWTRIDMLLHIYERAADAIHSGIRIMEQNAPQDTAQEMAAVRIQLHKALLLIADGLDLTAGEVPQNVMRLCLYAFDQTATDSSDAWRDASRVLAELHGAFKAIEDQARTMECEGKIRVLETVRQV